MHEISGFLCFLVVSGDAHSLREYAAPVARQPTTRQGTCPGALMFSPVCQVDLPPLLNAQRVKVAVWDAEEIVNRLFEHYETVPEDVKRNAPLRKDWIIDESGTGGPVDSSDSTAGFMLESS